MPLVPNTWDQAMKIVTITYPNDGRKLKRLIIGILKQNLATCIQRMNYMKSYFIYEWELVRREEKLVVMKTSADRVERLVNFVQKQHPYDCPEIIVQDVEMVEEKYLDWIQGR